MWLNHRQRCASSIVVLLLAVTVSNAILEDACCHVVAFEAEELAADGTWTFAASMSSLYEVETGWDQYCDSFQVRTDGPINGGESNYTVLGARTFGHPHPTEQPFTRRVRNVQIPDGVDTVVAVAHDTENGYCGNSLVLPLAGSEPTFVTAPPMTSPPTRAPTQSVSPPSRSPSQNAPDAPITLDPVTPAPFRAPSGRPNQSPQGTSDPTFSPTLPVRTSDPTVSSTLKPVMTTSAPTDSPTLAETGAPTGTLLLSSIAEKTSRVSVTVLVGLILCLGMFL